ncbi:hypothetical protein FRB95_009018 [Tulasnella sp. JGI-2019a]|nr:hypothetical protein FRB95_009018 [Tulasnella sp. JGI-2019a]
MVFLALDDKDKYFMEYEDGRPWIIPSEWHQMVKLHLDDVDLTRQSVPYEPTYVSTTMFIHNVSRLTAPMLAYPSMGLGPHSELDMSLPSGASYSDERAGDATGTI